VFSIGRNRRSRSTGIGVHHGPESAVAFQSTEALDGFEDAGGVPAYHYLPVAPALDAMLHMARAADETLGRIRRAQ